MADKPKLLLYNTLSGKEEQLKAISDKKLSMFVCGQTVYDDAHLGHAKSYINFSVVVRWLRHLGYSVKYIQNITDVDDKIIARARENGEDPLALARRFEGRFLEDMEAIGVRQDVDEYPRSHDYIDTIAEQVQMLADKGFAYLLDGDVYYDVSRFADYTKLSGMKLEELERHRIEPRAGKRNAYDFALWKAAKPGEPSWKITVRIGGKKTVLDGRPGWHIEDTAITYKIFGPQYDIHGGGSDLIFPHHTNEIAQAEGASGKKPFVRYWMHSGMVRVNGEKMSKSLKNFVTIRDVLKRHGAESLRVLVCSTHYRKEINYTEKLMAAAHTRLRYMYSALGIFYNANTAGGEDEEVASIASALKEDFSSAMNDDFNTPVALMRLSGSIDTLRNFVEVNGTVGEDSKKKALGVVLDCAHVLGILEEDSYKERLPDEADRLIKERELLRRQKRFADADRIRDRLAREHGIIIEDSEYGTLWYRG